MTGRLIIIVLLAFMTWKGYDGMQVNKDLVPYTIDQVAANGIGDDRYISISGGYTIGEFVYNYFEDNPNKASTVIFPLINDKQLNSYVDGKKILVKCIFW